jgi:hypothetical protein
LLEANDVLDILDKEKKLGVYRERVIPSLALYYAKKRVYISSTYDIFEQLLDELRKNLPVNLQQEIFGSWVD